MGQRSAAGITHGPGDGFQQAGEASGAFRPCVVVELNTEHHGRATLGADLGEGLPGCRRIGGDHIADGMTGRAAADRGAIALHEAERHGSGELPWPVVIAWEENTTRAEVPRKSYEISYLGQ